MKLRVIGPGRAGGSLSSALASRGWRIEPPVLRGDDPRSAARGVDWLVVATPDAAIADVADRVEPVTDTLVVHLSGALGLDVLAPHPRRASLHPLVSLPNPDLGARRLTASWFAVAGDEAVREAVTALEGRCFEVPDETRAAYHAAACIASNHLVALLGQVERIAAAVGAPLDAYLDLARQSLENVAELGPSAALTGPVARGDLATVARHLDALAPEERAAYEALAERAGRLIGRDDPTARGRPRRAP